MFFPSMGVGCLMAAPFYSLAMLPFYPDTSAQPLIPTKEIFLSAGPVIFVGGAMNGFAILLTIKVDFVISIIILTTKISPTVCHLLGQSIVLINYVVAMTISQMCILVTGFWAW
jgi:hypothetical protein